MQIKVITYNHVVQLSGFVDTVDMKARADVVAAQVAGGASAGKRTSELETKISRAVDAIIEGKAQATATPVNNVIDWHPNLADIYRHRLEELQEYLREEDTDPNLKQAAKWPSEA